jgi:hypothetical protein
MDCLRSLPAEELMQFTPNIRFAFFGSGWRSNGVHLIDDGVNFKALNNLLLKVRRIIRSVNYIFSEKTKHSQPSH